MLNTMIKLPLYRFYRKARQKLLSIAHNQNAATAATADFVKSINTTFFSVRDTANNRSKCVLAMFTC